MPKLVRIIKKTLNNKPSMSSVRDTKVCIYTLMPKYSRSTWHEECRKVNRYNHMEVYYLAMYQN